MAQGNQQTYTFNASQALAEIGRLTQAYNSLNGTIGQIVGVVQRVNDSGKTTSATFTQLNSSGKAVTTTVKEMANGFAILSQRLADATAKQISFARANNVSATVKGKNGQASTILGPNGQPLSPFTASGGSGGKGGPPPGSPANALFGGGPGGLPPIAFLQAYQANLSRIILVLRGIETQQGRVNSAAKQLGAVLAIPAGILVYQTLHRLFGTIIQDITESTAAAAEFDRQLGLIRTLTQGSGESIGKFRQEIIQIADTLGKPVVEVAEAAYQGFSNQILNSAKDFGLLSQAIEFGKVTNASAQDSIDLFASAINSFGLSAQDGQRIAAGFFKTIDLGRVTAQNLANTFGVIAPLAAEVGLSLEETNATIAKISQSGTKTEVSLTLAANALKAFLKPSKDLQAIFAETGVANGEEFIALAGGLEQALGKLTNGKTGTEIAKEFQDFRELRGVLSLTSDGVKSFNENLSEIKNSADSYNKAVGEMRSNTGQKFIDELIRVKNYFTTEFGGTIISIIQNITGLFGGAVNAVSLLTKALLLLAAAATTAFAISKVIAFTTYVNDAFILIQSGTKVMAAFGFAGVASLGPVGVTIIGIATAAAAVVAIFSTIITNAAFAKARIAEALRVNIQDAKQKYQPETDAFKTSIDEQVALFEDGQRAQQQAFLTTVSVVQKNLNTIRSAQINAYKDIIDSLKRGFDAFLDTLNSNLDAIKSKQKAALSEVLTSGKAVADALKRQGDNTFNNSQGFVSDPAKRGDVTLNVENRNSPREAALSRIIALNKQLNDLTERGIKGPESLAAYNEIAEKLKRANVEAGGANRSFTQLSGSAATVASESVDVRNNLLKSRVQADLQAGDFARARESLDEMDSNIQKLASQLVTINGVTSQAYDTDAASNQLLKLRIQYENQIISAKQKEVAETEKIRLQEEDRVRVAKDLFDKIADFKATDKDGKLLPQFKGNPENAVAALRKEQNDALKLIGGTNVLGSPGILKDFAEQGQQLRQQLLGQQGNLRDQASTGAAQGALDREKEEFSQLSKKAGQLVKEFNDGLKTAADGLQNTKALFFGTLKSLGESEAAGAIDEAISGGSGDLISRIKELVESGDGPKAIAIIRETAATLREAQGLRPLGALDKPGIKVLGEDQTLSQNLDFLQQQIQLMEKIEAFKVNTTSDRDSTQQQFGALARKLTSETAAIVPDLENIVNATKAIGPAAAQAAEATEVNFSLLGKSADAASERIRALKANIQSIAPLGEGANTEPGAPEGFALGGRIQYAALGKFLRGGYARGVDTIPVMARPGEMMMNPRAVNRFAPDLISMNAGRRPSVNNNQRSLSMGDIHVHMEGGSTNAQTAADLGRAIRREVQLGRVSLS